LFHKVHSVEVGKHGSIDAFAGEVFHRFRRRRRKKRSASAAAASTVPPAAPQAIAFTLISCGLFVDTAVAVLNPADKIDDERPDAAAASEPVADENSEDVTGVLDVAVINSVDKIDDERPDALAASELVADENSEDVTGVDVAVAADMNMFVESNAELEYAEDERGESEIAVVVVVSRFDLLSMLNRYGFLKMCSAYVNAPVAVDCERGMEGGNKDAIPGKIA
jgi:hypothetical protein